MADSMIPGAKYRLRHRSDTQRYDRYSVMVFLEETVDEYLFSARPLAGTQHMPKEWLFSAIQVADDERIYMNSMRNMTDIPRGY